MTPSKQSSEKRCSGVVSTLTRRIGTCSLWCALNARTKNIIEKLDLRQKSMCTSINKAGYGHLRMGNSNMQSLILRKSAAFWRIWRRSLLQTFSSRKFERPWIWGYCNHQDGVLWPCYLVFGYFGNADQCTSSRGKSFVQRIATLEKRSLYR